MIRKLILGTSAAGLLLAALPASAADLAVVPMPAPVAVPVPVFTWTGWYIGGNAGAAWRHRNNWLSDPTFYPGNIGFPAGFGCGAFNCSNNRTSFTGGGQIGFNWQTGAWVWGVEGDVEYVDNNRRNNNRVTFTLPGLGARGVAPGPLALGPGTYTAFWDGRDDGHNDGNVLGTIRARLGFAWDRFLVFGTGGAAFRSSNDNRRAFIVDGGGATVATYSCGVTFNCRDDHTVGWAAGGGVQYAVTNNVSIGVEYLHADFGRRDRLDPILTSYFGTPTTSTRDRQDVDIVRARLDIKFGGLFGTY